MTVYVDETRTYPPASFTNKAAMRFGFDWCHMWADTEAELHAMAARIGVPRSAYQGQYARPQFRHYDLIPAKRAKAIKAGAVFMSARDRGAQVAAEIAAEIASVTVPELLAATGEGEIAIMRISESPGAANQLEAWRL